MADVSRETRKNYVRVPGEEGIAVESKCQFCNAGNKPMLLAGRMTHRFHYCTNYDHECRHAGEPFGYYEVAWLPRRCRNGIVRWLTWVEHHSDGTYTLGNRAH